MKYWKLGCRWGSKSKGLPLFNDLLEKYQIVISWIDKDFEKDNIILLTDGFTPLAIAITKSERKPIENLKHLEYKFTEKQIDFDDDLFYYEADIFPLASPNFEFQYQVGISIIHNEETIAHINQYLQKILPKKEMKNTINILKHKNQIILQGPPGTGKTRLAKQIANEICSLNTSSENQDENALTINHNQSNQVEIIQFHPSYTYEDFVRGISVKSNNNNVEYKTENKVLATIAEKALNNYNNTLKDVVTYSKETKVEEYFELFKEKILTDLEDSDGFLELTERICVTDLEVDAFRYNGKNIKWSKLGNRMLFKDIIQAYLDGNKERQDIKKNNNLSGLARQHASYFVRVLNWFQKFLEEKNLPLDNIRVEKEALKNYVLIIDEINRANLSSVLGELIYALEYRGEPVESMYEMEDGVRKITLPPNLYIIGTMNTADRSVGQIDYAIRRRFAFVDVLPKVLSNADLNKDREENKPELFFKEDLFLKVQELFKNEDNTNSDYLSEEFEANEVQLGHSYFIYEKDSFELKLKYEIKPILKEYVKDGILKPNALEFIQNEL